MKPAVFQTWKKGLWPGVRYLSARVPVRESCFGRHAMQFVAMNQVPGYFCLQNPDWQGLSVTAPVCWLPGYGLGYGFRCFFAGNAG